MRGATARPCVFGIISWCFNPRAREGRDTHRPILRLGVRRFNPRAREGRDTHRPILRLGVRRFNPRAREGRDTHRPILRLGVRRFNPRAREGRDLDHRQAVLAKVNVSIHAPVRGATTAPLLHRVCSNKFQSTRP